MLRVAIVGATGAVGEELFKVLEERRFPVKSLRAFASARSKGRFSRFQGRDLEVEELDVRALVDQDVVFLSAGAEVSRRLRPVLCESLASVYDNTSAFRMDPDVPLVVPEVNADCARSSRWVAVPNCTAILLVLALHPLHRAFGLRRVIVSTYQAVSGAGRRALQSLLDGTRAELSGEPPSPASGAHPFAFNVIPLIGGMADAGIGLSRSTGEEAKVVLETRRILGHPSLSMVVTCVRVPVLRAHSESVTVELDALPTVDEIRETLRRAPGVEVRDEPDHQLFPTPRGASGRDGILVGRIREGDARGCFSFFLSGDQLRKGAALNAVQIAELRL